MMSKYLLIFVIIAVIILAVLLTLSFQNAVSSSNELMRVITGLIF